MDEIFRERIEALNNSDAAEMPRSIKRTYTVDEIQDILSISKTTAYNLVKTKAFHSVRIGGHIRISKKSFDTWLDQLEAEV